MHATSGTCEVHVLTQYPMHETSSLHVRTTFHPPHRLRIRLVTLILQKNACESKTSMCGYVPACRLGEYLSKNLPVSDHGKLFAIVSS